MSGKQHSGSLYDSVYIAERTRAHTHTESQRPQHAASLYDAGQSRTQREQVTGGTAAGVREERAKFGNK